MKIISSILIVMLSYNLSALACGGKQESTYKAKTLGQETQLSLGVKEVLILNSHSKMIKAENEYSDAVIPLRFEVAPGSDTRLIAVQTRSSVTYLSRFAKYRCIGTPTETEDIYVSVGDYTELKVYLLKEGEKVIAESREADVVLKGDEIKKLLKK